MLFPALARTPRYQKEYVCFVGVPEIENVCESVTTAGVLVHASDEEEARPESPSWSVESEPENNPPLHPPVFEDVHELKFPYVKVLFAKIGLWDEFSFACVVAQVNPMTVLGVQAVPSLLIYVVQSLHDTARVDPPQFCAVPLH
jgi:hypothetical protein